MPSRKLSLAALLLVGCSQPSTQPHDASAHQHELDAQEAEQRAGKHAGRTDPFRACSRSRTAWPDDTCWSSPESNRQAHDDLANRLRALAAQHRAASKALLDAEHRSCAAVSEYDRDLSPFFHREDIATVSRLERDGELTGAEILFRPVAGLDAQHLQRLVDCHLARAASVGHDMPEMDYCPLVPRGVAAKVREVGKQLAVDVTSSDSSTVHEIVVRAEKLRASD